MMWDDPLECGQPTRAHIITEDWFYPPQHSPTASSSSAGMGGSHESLLYPTVSNCQSLLSGGRREEFMNPSSIHEGMLIGFNLYSSCEGSHGFWGFIYA